MNHAQGARCERNVIGRGFNYCTLPGCKVPYGECALKVREITESLKNTVVRIWDKKQG